MLHKVKYYILVICLLLSFLPTGYSQNQKKADSLSIIYNKGMLSDAERMELLRQLSFNEVKDLNLALKYSEELIELAQETGNKKYLFAGYFQKGNKKRMFGDLEEALEAYIKSAEIAHQENNRVSEGNSYGTIADIYSMSNNHENARLYYNKSIAILRESKDSIALASAILNAGEEFRLTQIYDTAYAYFEESGRIFDKLDYTIGKAYNQGNIGMIYASTGKNELAEAKIKEAIDILEESEDYYPICAYLISMADIYNEKGDKQIALNYTLRSLSLATKYELKEQIRDANLKLSELYDQLGNTGESYKYYKDYIVYRDSINNIKKVQSLANLRTDFEVSQKQFEVDRLSRQKQNQRWWIITIAGILFTTFVLLFMFYRNMNIRKKANNLLHIQKKKVETALANLKDTQAQLIQAEKMASLGELTAGIAHEIQNPLNFVNNFSELNRELIEELKEELAAGNAQLVNEIASDIEENEQKINHHGKRAETIVKGMLLHSRGSSGQKEPTDINALAEEYLRLSYHGFRAKDKSFNADFKLEAYDSLPKINVVPQDIGRVLLNLINNAFHAVNEKAKENIQGYKPEVVVRTSSSAFGERGKREVKITVADNGPGIPDSIKDKIFQPFFTTKPTGSGTGLGLSLSYDIVKAHGGELKVETKEGESRQDDSFGWETMFIIQLPSTT